MRSSQRRECVLRDPGYDSEDQILEVEFINGRIYRYFNVPELLYRGFSLARSKGEYFNRRISDRFRSEELR